MSLGAFLARIFCNTPALLPENLSSPQINPWFVHLLVEGVDRYFDEIRERGAEILSPPGNRDYGLREFVIRTPDGHRIVVGEPL